MASTVCKQNIRPFGVQGCMYCRNQAPDRFEKNLNMPVPAFADSQDCRWSAFLTM